MERLKQLVNDHADEFFTHSKKSDLLISKAEQVLEVKLPQSYKDFVLEWGMMSFEGLEFYGIIHEDFANSGLPDAVWFTLHLRRQFDFPKNLVVFLDHEGDEYLCLDTNDYFSPEECAIVLWDNVEKEVADRYEISFGDFLIEEIEQAFEIE
jgi:hypothetical protein